MSSTHPPVEVVGSDAERLLHFNRLLIDQALSLVDAHEVPGAPAYGHYTGPHLRHVIEHYEALLLRGTDSDLDYDRRPRDGALDQSARIARVRLCGLKQHLADAEDTTLDRPVHVRGQGGVTGEFDFVTRSSVGRELVFLASHAIHHFALLRIYCQQHGIPTDPDFGRAPSTVAHAKAATASASPIEPRKESACLTSQSAA
ncbi:MAG: hypothetical protein K2Q07_04170 [Burkholderiaceae bacterium]|nr:hypothetical protein [Burkholderiaceae bacterium]